MTLDATRDDGSADDVDDDDAYASISYGDVDASITVAEDDDIEASVEISHGGIVDDEASVEISHGGIVDDDASVEISDAARSNPSDVSVSYGDATFEVPEDDASTSLDARDAPDLRPRAAAATPLGAGGRLRRPETLDREGPPSGPSTDAVGIGTGRPRRCVLIRGGENRRKDRRATVVRERPTEGRPRPRERDPPATDRIHGGERRASDETDPAGFGFAAAAAAAAPWAGAFDDDGADADSRSPEQAANAFPERRTTTTSRSDDETDPGAAPWPGALDADSDEESRERSERDDSVPAVDRPIGGARPDAFASRRDATSPPPSPPPPPPAAASVVSADADAFGGDARRLPSSPSASSPAAAEAEDATEALHRRLAANDPLAMLKARAARIATEDAAKEEDDVVEAEAEASAASATEPSASATEPSASATEPSASATEPSASATEPSAPESESARLARADARWSGGGSAAFPWTRAAEDSPNRAGGFAREKETVGGAGRGPRRARRRLAGGP